MTLNSITFSNTSTSTVHDLSTSVNSVTQSLFETFFY